MSSAMWAILLKPFAAFLLLLAILPLRVVIERWIRKHVREGRLKRVLLFSWRV